MKDAVLPTVRLQLEEVTQINRQVGEYFHIQRIGAEAEEPNWRWEMLD